MSYMEQAMQQQIESGVSEAARCYEEIEALRAERDALAAKNHQLLAVLSDIQQQCIGEIAMSYPMSPEHIGQQIYQATGMTEPELRAKVRQGGEQ